MVKREKESDSDSGSSSSGDDHEWGKKAKEKKAKKRVKSVKEEEREEGEVDDDEDDDDLDDDEVEEFNDGFDDHLMGDEEDQKRLAEMTEKEREQELFNRSEKREVLRTRFEIERKLRLQKRKESGSKDKATKSDAFTEASLRSDERRRNIESKKKQNTALQGLKEQREKKKQKQQILRAADVYSSSSSSDDDDDDGGRKGSSSSSSSSSDESDDGRKHRGRESDEDQPDDYILTIEDLNKIRVTRIHMEKWCHTPFFATTMIGSFVKMGVGAKGLQQIYRVCQVLEVVEGTIAYELGRTKTNKQLKVKHANDEKSFRLAYVSNSEIEENEFMEWKSRMERDKIDLPTRSLVESKKKDIENAKIYQYSDNDIASILKEKEKFNKTPKNYAMKKTELMKTKEEAEQNNNHELVASLQIELDCLEERAKELDKQRTHSIAAISYINERNRLRNIAETEKAICEDRMAESQFGEGDDPFRRRKCAPQLVVHKTKKDPDGTPIKSEPGSEIKTESNGSSSTGVKTEPSDESKTTVKVEVKTEKRTPLSPSRDDLFDAHNFEIQIDFDMPTSVTASSSFATGNSSSGPGVKPSTNRRSLNLEEYKRKKGLI